MSEDPGPHGGVDQEALRSALAEAQAQAEENWNELWRARADAENVRKRALREMDETRKFALRNFLRDLLPVKDSLEKGLAAARDEANVDASQLLRGTEITLRQLEDLLARNGVTEIDPKLGEAFDPEVHEAVEMRHVADASANVIVEVFQKGYLLHGRMLRPARVAVSASCE